jgi:hypothetical protein
MNALLLALVMAPSPERVFQNAIRAHAQMQSGGVTIERTATDGKQTRKAVVEVDFVRPGRALVRTRMGRTEYVELAEPNRLTSARVHAREQLEPRRFESRSAVQLLGQSSHPTEEAAMLMISEQAFRTWVSARRPVNAWKASAIGDQTTVTQGSGQNRNVILFNSRTGRISGLDFRRGAVRLQWKIRYRSLRPVRMPTSPPLRTVIAFTATPTIRFANAQAKSLVATVIRSHATFVSGKVDVQDDEGDRVLLFGGGRFRQNGRTHSWAFDGRTTTLVDTRRKRRYRGTSGRATAVESFSRAGGRLDPYLRAIVQRQIPFLDVLTGIDRASVRGQTVVGNDPCLILEVTSRRNRSSLFVSTRSGRVRSITTETFGSDGSVVATTIRRFRYAPLPPSTTFQLPAGTFANAPLP